MSRRDARSPFYLRVHLVSGRVRQRTEAHDDPTQNECPSQPAVFDRGEAIFAVGLHGGYEAWDNATLLQLARLIGRQLARDAARESDEFATICNNS